ncbi:hypothetical protein CY35_08G042800 [Sphagnum magellanicum]|nr:hypothetical protein CY35_08G042800 [Sphagnum magellanicum]KAH9554022.1 hypothetical protein CY35_08G042800 [Sphagnum magellanicum]
MQYAVQSCMHGRLQCSSSSFSLFSHHRLSTSPVVAPGVAPCVMLHRRREFIGSCGKGASSNALSNNKGSLSSHFLLRGVAVVKLLPQQYTGGLDRNGRWTTVKASVGAYNKEAFVDDAEAQKLAQVAKRLERTAGYFRRLGNLGFWGQLICTVVSAVILAFSIVITGQATSPVSIYLTAGGIATAFLSVFWSFGYIRLSHQLRETIDDPTKAPPRAQVVKNLKNGVLINLLGMGSTLLGLQATVGVLVAKALTSSSTPYLQGAPAGFSPVLALDVFLVQASANAILSHFLGLVFSLELLRSVTLAQPPPENVIPKPA